MTFASLAARNILRNKLRTFLTVMGVGIAVMTFLLLRTVISAWTAAADFAAKDRVVISLNRKAPRAVKVAWLVLG